MAVERDICSGVTGVTLVAAGATWLQLHQQLTHPDYIYRPGALVWLLMGSSVTLALLVCVRLWHQFGVRRGENVTALLPGLALLGTWVLLRHVFAVSVPTYTLGLDTVFFARWAAPFLHYALPAIGAAGVLGAGYALWRSLPIPLARVQASQPAPRVPSQAEADAPTGDRWSARKARFNFDAMFGNSALKSALLRAGEEWRQQGRNGILLYGPPGTGKTMAAEALAGQLGLKFLPVTFGNVASKWINQTTEHVVEVFRSARRNQPVLLFLDELDAIITRRHDGATGFDEYDRITTTFLTEAVNLRGCKILLVGATNHLDRLDDAAVREGRFDFKVEVPLPDAAARRGLVQATLARLGCSVDGGVLTRLVARWAGFNIPRINTVTERACEAALQAARGNAHPALSYADFYAALRQVQGGKGGAPEGAKRLEELFLEAEARQRLNTLAVQLTHVEALENEGGSLPRGIVFYGPPGTGKTAAAMALARACGWTFIQRRGRDLMRTGAVDDLREEAGDLRPAIVFLDEADDILADREVSGYKTVTNELLTLIDGAGGTLQDVVWIAATNHIEAMDSAATRGGRFGLKVYFGVPGTQVLERIVADWAGHHAASVEGDPAAWAAGVAPILAGVTPATAYAVLDQANNDAVADSLTGASSRLVSLAHVQRALGELGGITA